MQDLLHLWMIHVYHEKQTFLDISVDCKINKLRPILIKVGTFKIYSPLEEKRLVSVKLHATTGIDYLDTLLANLVTRFEQSFPARIRSYYLGGSSSDGTAAGYDQSPNSSD